MSVSGGELVLFERIALTFPSGPGALSGRGIRGLKLTVRAEIIAAEMVGATVGMGYMVLEAQQTFRTERVFAGILVIGVIGFTTDLGFRWLRRWLPWHRETDYA